MISDLVAGRYAVVELPEPGWAQSSPVGGSYWIRLRGGRAVHGLDFGNHLNLDFGDVPDPTYATLQASGGAHHVIDAVHYLGSGVDAEADGQPHAAALGDDGTGTDDEDGVVFTTPLALEAEVRIEVTASAAGFLDAWLDFNADGDWDDPGAHTVVEAIPEGWIQTYPVGTATHAVTVPDGQEVANVDFGSRLVTEKDFGDAPEQLGYPTLEGSDGASHAIVPGFFLGSSIDSEDDGQPSDTAEGDDGQNVDDGDGVVFTTDLIPARRVRRRGRRVLRPYSFVEVTASTDGVVNAWIDYNADGDWDDEGEHVLVNEPVVAGTTEFLFFVPSEAVPGSTFARFRLSSTGGSPPRAQRLTARSKTTRCPSGRPPRSGAPYGTTATATASRTSTS